MIAAVYARKSTEQTGADADAKSVARQIENARAFAAAKRWAVADAHVYADDAISGAETKRLVNRQRLLDVLAGTGTPPFRCSSCGTPRGSAVATATRPSANSNGWPSAASRSGSTRRRPASPSALRGQRRRLRLRRNECRISATDRALHQRGPGAQGAGGPRHGRPRVRL
jgi:hypothetical protein